ncbi:uncharacterized protein H6S33_010060 [Morchella sextelata]|uniref:uncharacterized protein n=1 Tax=Morchella sextelata TaxID=1174677 RepID=UPI001D0558F5|nr:uncharacterized protein H6S33_010060 [Morchella sextelata]KAH0612008.1 hypothetical protein H6S33_010060 [Morchella sextelata]
MSQSGQAPPSLPHLRPGDVGTDSLVRGGWRSYSVCCVGAAAAPKRTEGEAWKWLDIRITEADAQSGKFKTLWTDRVVVCSVVVKQEKDGGFVLCR